MDGIQLILLYMLKKIDGERSIAGCYHILTGKKSTQAIQDAALYGFTSWFGIFPDWSRASFEKEVRELVEKGQLVWQDKQLHLSEEAKYTLAHTLANCHFQRRAFLASTSLWTGQEAALYSKKFHLLSQVISYYLAKQQSYLPIVQDVSTQLTVKTFWQSIVDKPSFVKLFVSEVYSFLEDLEDDLLAAIIVERLSGHQIHGRTFQQMAARFNIPEALLRLYYFQATSLLMERSLNSASVLHGLVTQGGTAAPGSLTISARKTYALLQKGLNIEEISESRQLKRNTIEDHLIEIAIHVDGYDFSTFISRSVVTQVATVSKQLKTRKLRELKESLPQEISYFQIRLALILDKRAKSVRERYNSHDYA